MGLAMKVRGRLPQRWHGAAQDAYVTVGRATTGLRLRPSFVMVGASRAGTTSLFEALCEHPQVRRPALNKGVRYFDVNWWRPQSWYFGHFPLADRGSPSMVTFEASGYYLFHPWASERMHQVLPEARVIAMLRDPVERAWSAWKHETGRGFEWEPFERALELEDERLVGEAERMRSDPTYESFCHRHHAHRSRGEYARQLEAVLSVYPRESVLVLDSGAYFADPETEFTTLLDFLELDRWLPERFDRLNARPSADMPSSARAALRAHYAPHDQRLADLLGHPMSWMDPAR